MIAHFWFGDSFTSRSIELELLEIESSQNQCHKVIYCDSCLPACTINPDGNRQVCICCESRTRYHYSLVTSKDNLIPLSMFVNTNNDIRCKEAKEISKTDLLNNDDDSLPCGIGVVSSVISLTRDEDFRNEYTRMLAGRLAQSSKIVCSAVIEAVNQLSPNRCYVHNGRLCEYYTVLAVCRQLGSEVVTHEITSNTGRWDRFINGRIHDRHQYARLIADSTINVPLTELCQVAEDFFTSKRIGTIERENFTKLQVQGKLPPSFRQSKYVIVVFLSSQDEFAALGPDWDMPIFESQISALNHIIPSCKAHNPDIEFVVRMHPNMQHMHPDDLNEYSDLAHLGCSLVWPCEDVDSYALLDSAEKVLTFGSTIGCEATFWGKPVVQIGHSLFEHLDVCYLPQTANDVTDLLIKSLEPKSKIGACQYAYALVKSGICFKYVNWHKQSLYGKPFFTILSPTVLRLHSVFRFVLATKLLAHVTRYWHYLRVCISVSNRNPRSK